MNEFEAEQNVGQGQVEAVAGADRSLLDEVLRQGAGRMLMTAIEAEVTDYVEAHKAELDEAGRRRVVRNGHGRARTIVTPVGPISLRAPRVDDRRRDEQGRKFRFTSKILPPYLRRTKSIEELIPWLYLKGISTGDFNEALAALLGPDAPGLSATSVVRMKEVWRGEYETWSRRDLSAERYVYLWADGIYCNVRLDDERQCFLVLIGATADGRKQLLAVHDGFRESELSWTEVLEDLKGRGLAIAPKLAVGDGALGFWAALRKVFPATGEQRCWVHKTANVLNKLPQSMQGKAKAMLHDIWRAESREAACRAFDTFVALYRQKFKAAVQCLEKDREQLLAFYDFGRALEPPAHDQPDRIDLRHRSTAPSAHQGPRKPGRLTLDDLHAYASGRAPLAPAQRLGAHRSRARRNTIQGWNHDPRMRRLIKPPSTTFDNISGGALDEFSIILSLFERIEKIVPTPRPGLENVWTIPNSRGCASLHPWLPAFALSDFSGIQ